MIFPGMDPYLEHPYLWSGVHTSLIVYIRDALQPLLRPKYIAAIVERVYVEGPDKDRIPDLWVQRRRKHAALKRNGRVAVLEPDEPVVVKVSELEIREVYVTILNRYTDEKLVTLIEVVSPTNKHVGPGQDSYLAKQTEILNSHVHLVEIDLLRTGRHVLAVPEREARQDGDYDYLVSVNRAIDKRNQFELYPRMLQERLPVIRIPLGTDDADVPLDIQSVLEKTYESGGYADRLLYSKKCQPPLSRENQAWAWRLIKKAQKNSRERK